MQENLIAYWHTIEAHLRIVIFSFFIVFLLIVLYFKNNDSAEPINVEASTSSSSTKPKIDPKAGPDPLVKQIEEALVKTPAPITKTAYAPLITNSMFDVKAVRDAMEQEKAAQDKYNQAAALFGEKKYREAYEMVNQCLKLRQNHLAAKKLLAELEQVLEGVGGGKPRPTNP